MKPQNNNTPAPKLTLNKRTIVLLNEQNMEMINGMGGKLTKNPDDPQCQTGGNISADAICKPTLTH